MIVSKHNCPKLVSRTGVQKGEVASPFHYGSVTEGLMVPILKIGNRDERFVGSNPTASAIKGCSLMVKYQSPKP